MMAGDTRPSDPAAPGPLFVVGPSRSGTSLIRAILNRHQSVALAGETHYFDDLRIRLHEDPGAALGADNRRMCEEYFLRLSHRPYGHGGTVADARLDVRMLRRRADALGGSADAHFRAYCEMVAEDEGAAVWGDKTPRHIFRIGEILTAFPSARVVVMMRDPRSVVLSYRDWKNDQGGFDFDSDPDHKADVERDNDRARRSYDVIVLSLLWRTQARAAMNAIGTFGGERVRLVKYEDVVDDFDATVSALVRWIGIDFQEDMADVPILNSSFAEFNRGGGVSSHSRERWRGALTDREIGLIQSASGREASNLGYSLEPVRVPKLVLLWHWGRLPFASARALLANKDRTGRLIPYVSRRVGLALRGR